MNQPRENPRISRLRTAGFGLGAALGIAVLLWGCAGAPASSRTLKELSALAPTPALGPEEVVSIQMEALRLNDSRDRGIEIVFRFASPENRRFTGPLARFAAMIKGPLYSPMLNHKGAVYGSLEVSGDSAFLPVSVTTDSGETVVYVFYLTRQSGGPFAGCWMTDGVQIGSVRELTDGMI
jgi:hypothetical protein